ncbi:hypothetical protein BC30102_0463 [Bacillus cereus]|nr:hypothetical protein BC30102_0463 [Bacillus cereus]
MIRKDCLFEKCMPYLSQKKPALYTLRCMDVILKLKKIIGGEVYVSVQKILA